MTYKIITTLLLVVTASALLINLASRVRLTAADAGQGVRTAATGCCGSGCGVNRQNQTKGE